LAALEPEMATGLVAPKFSTGGFCAPEGLAVMTAVSATFPVKPPAGVTTMVDVFPVVAPAVTVTDEALRVKPGGATAVMATVLEVLGA